MIDVSKAVETSIRIMRENVALRTELKKLKQKIIIMEEALQVSGCPCDYNREEERYVYTKEKGHSNAAF